MDHGLLSTREVGERLAVSERTIARWCQDGLVPGAFKVGRAWLIPEASLAAIDRPRLGRPLGEPKPDYGRQQEGDPTDDVL